MQTRTDENALAGELSISRERAIARRYIGRIQWEMILWGLGQLALWLTVLVLGIRGDIPLWLGFPIATFCCAFAYLPSHEAQHGNIAGHHENLQWLNDLVGHASLLNLGYPYGYLRATHMQHHAFTNEPELDPDHHYITESWWQAALEAHREPNRAVLERHLANNPVFERDLTNGILARKLMTLVQLVCAVIWPLPVFFLWWLPQKLGISYTVVFLSWRPHQPARETSRYRNAKIWLPRVLPRYLVQSMTHHAIHHLYPRIPHWSQPAALRELRPFIEARGMAGADLLADYPYGPRAGATTEPERAPHPGS